MTDGAAELTREARAISAFVKENLNGVYGSCRLMEPDGAYERYHTTVMGTEGATHQFIVWVDLAHGSEEAHVVKSELQERPQEVGPSAHKADFKRRAGLMADSEDVKERVKYTAGEFALAICDFIESLHAGPGR